MRHTASIDPEEILLHSSQANCPGMTAELDSVCAEMGTWAGRWRTIRSALPIEVDTAPARYSAPSYKPLETVLADSIVL